MEYKTKEIEITKIFKNYESKDGKKYKSPLVALYFNGEDDVEYKVSAFVEADSEALTWEKGDVVTLKMFKSGNFVNFVPPTITDKLIKRIEALEAAVFSPKGAGATTVKKAPKDNPNATVEEKEAKNDFPW